MTTKRVRGKREWGKRVGSTASQYSMFPAQRGEGRKYLKKNQPPRICIHRITITAHVMMYNKVC